jgi:hypothetical protein
MGDCDPNKSDTDRLLFVCVDCSSPTDGVAGQHIIASSLNDDGDNDGIEIASDVAWHQVDDDEELSLTASKFDGFVSKAEGAGLVYLSTTQGILEIAGEQGSASYSDPVTCAWVGTPARPTCTTSSAAGLLSGAYQYKVTFVTALGETLPSKPSVSISVITSKVTVVLPTGGDEVLQRKIYRTKGGGVSLDNDSFENWTSSEPDDWTTSGASATFTASEDLNELIDGCEDSWTAGHTSATKTEGTYSAVIEDVYVETPPPVMVGYSSKVSTATVANPGYETVSFDEKWPSGETPVLGQSYLRLDTAVGYDIISASGGSTSWTTSVGSITVSTNAFTFFTVKFCTDGYAPWSGDAYIDNIRGQLDGARTGTYAIRISRSGTDALAEQTIDASGMGGAPATFTCWVKTATASIARIGIYDDGDTTTAWSDYHDGDNEWQKLSVTKDMDASASTGAKVYLQIGSSDGFAYFDDVELAGGSGGTDGYFYLDAVADNTTTSYLDNTADTSLAVQEDLSSRCGVPTGEWLTYHNNRLFSIGKCIATTQSQLLWYSDDGDVENWPSENWIQVGNDADVATGLASHQEILYVLKRKSIWRLRGYDSDDFELRKVADGVGCEDGRTIAITDEGIYFYGNNTVWLFDGSRINNLGHVMETGYLQDVYIDNSDTSYQASALFAGDRYRLAYKLSSAGSYATYVLDYNRRSQVWSRVQQAGYPSVWHNPATLSGKAISVGSDGRIWEILSGGHDDASNQRMEWFTHALDFGDRLVDKRIDKVILSVDSTWATTGTAYSVSLYRNVTEEQIRTRTLPSAHTTKLFSISEGLNTLEWGLGSESVSNVYRTVCVGVSEYGESDDTSERTEKPPRLLGLYIQYRLFERRN